MPDSFWRSAYIKTILEFNGPVFLEGPLPTELSHLKGFEPTGRQIDEGFLSPAGNEKLTHLQAWPSAPLQEIENNRIHIGPKRVSTLLSEPSRRELCVGIEHNRQIRLHDTLLSHLLAYKQRFDRFGLFYKDVKIDLLAWIVWLEALDKMMQGSHREYYSNWLRGGIASLPDTQNLEGKTQTLSMLGTVYTMVSRVLGHNMHQKADEIVELLLKQVGKVQKLPTSGLALSLCFLTMHAFGDKKRQAAEKAARHLVDRLKAADPPFNVEVLWAAALTVGNRNENIHKFLANALFELVSGLGREPRTILNKFEQRPLWEILLFSGILVSCGVKELAATLLDLCMENTFDAQEGFFKSAVVKAGDFEIGHGYQSMPWIAIGLLPHVERIRFRNPKEQPDTYSSPQKRAWKAQPWFVENNSGYDGEVRAILRNGSEEEPALVSKGSLTVSSFQLLSFVVHYHTMHPLNEPFCDCPSFHAQFIESMLIKTLLSMASEGGIYMPLLAPWPFGYRYCMTIRHDVDRIPDEETFSKLLEFETDNRLGVSWFWIPTRVNSRYMARIKDRGFENGLHAMHLARKREEIAAVESALPSGMKVYGESYHGGGGGDYWRGPSSVMDATEAGLHYSELSSNLPVLPSTGFPMMKKDGTIYLSRIVGLTNLCSVDEGVRRRTMNLIDFESIRQMANSGAYLTILNHPDINFEELCRWVEHTPQKGRLNWTCARVARWWRVTHDRSSVDLGNIEKRKGKIILNAKFKYDSEEQICLRLLINGASCTRVQTRFGGRIVDTNWRRSTVEGLPCIDIGFVLQKEKFAQIEIHFG